MKNQKFVSVVLSVTLSFLGVAVIAYGATTIGTAITTSGNLSVTGTGLTTLVNASTTIMEASNYLAVNGMATTSSTGNIATKGTLTVTGTSGFTGLMTLVNATTTGNGSIAGNLWINGNATTTSTGAISTQNTLTVVGDTFLTTASSTGLVKVQSLKVGASGTTFTKAVGDYCTIAGGNITASTTGYMNCTPRITGLVAVGNPVMVTATSSLHKNFIITQASSSVTDIIGLAIYNSGQDTTVATGLTSLNFFIMSGQSAQ